MCGRYVSPEQAAVERAWHIGRHNLGSLLNEAFEADYNVAPSDTVPVLRWADGALEIVAMRWGLIPAFAKGVPGSYKTFNARAETLQERPAYRTAWKRNQRCLVPARGFYEWQAQPGGKLPWFISCADQAVFAFAGLWDSSTPEGGEPVLSCAIITVDASPFMATIHTTASGEHREPVILRPEAWQAWLAGTPVEAQACLKPYPDELRSAWPVSRRVNAVRNNDAQLIEPAAA